jgi:hypothetical protein
MREGSQAGYDQSSDMFICQTCGKRSPCMHCLDQRPFSHPVQVRQQTQTPDGDLHCPRCGWSFPCPFCEHRAQQGAPPFSGVGEVYRYIGQGARILGPTQESYD